MLQHSCNISTQKSFVSRGRLYTHKSLLLKISIMMTSSLPDPVKSALLIGRLKLQSLQDIQSTYACVCNCYRSLSFFGLPSCTWEYEGAHQRIDDVESLHRLLSSGGVTIATSSKYPKQFSTTFWLQIRESKLCLISKIYRLSCEHSRTQCCFPADQQCPAESTTISSFAPSCRTARKNR